MHIRFLFLIQKPVCTRVIRPVFSAAANRGVSNSMIFCTESVRELLSPELTITTQLEDALEFNPDVIFSAREGIPADFSGLRVNLFDSLFTGRKDYFSLKPKFDLYCTSGPSITLQFMKLARRKKNFMVSQTGWPAADLLLDSNSRTNARKTLKISENERPVVFIPGNRFLKLDRDSMKEFLSSFPKKERCIIYFSNGFDPAVAAKIASIKPRNLHFFRHPDISSLYLAADLLVTEEIDRAYEFSLMKKPVIFIGKSKNVPEGTEADYRNFGIKISSILASPENEVVKWQKLLSNIHPYTDGRSSFRILQVVSEIINSKLKNDLRQSNKP